MGMHLHDDVVVIDQRQAIVGHRDGVSRGIDNRWRQGDGVNDWIGHAISPCLRIRSRLRGLI